MTRRRRASLIDQLAAALPVAPPEPPMGEIVNPTLRDKAQAQVAEWDETYQAFIRAHLDPWLANSLQDRQMQALTGNAQRQISPLEKDINRSLISTSVALGLIGLDAVTKFNFKPLILGIGLSTTWPACKENWRIAVEERRLSILHLLLGYAFSLWFSGAYTIAVSGLLLGSLSSKVLLLTQTITRHSLSHLFGEQPAHVWVVVDGVEMQIPFEALQVGDILVLDAGQAVPVDGVVVSGTATVDQHRLTGESQPAEKTVGDPMLAATLVVGGRIQVRVEKTGAETAAARIGEVLNRTVERQQIRLADQFRNVEHTLIPTLAAGAVGWVVHGPATGFAMMGCNYLVGTLSLRILTLLKSLSAGAERAILIKDGRAFEGLNQVDTLIFDKTGTLTLERPEVMDIHCGGTLDAHRVLQLAAAAEHRQTHPIAHAILEAAAERGLEIPAIDAAHYEIGAGLTIHLDGQKIRVGSHRFMLAEAITVPETLAFALDAAQARGHSLVFVAVEEMAVGAIELAASLRPETQAVVGWLRERGFALYILSGDQEGPTRELAAQLGMDGYFANTMPEQKAERVKALQAQGKKVCFVGDGINDAVALLQADVSVSFRGATTIATDAAQVVLMEDHLEQLQMLFELAGAYDREIQGIATRAKNFSFAAGTGVLLLPAQQYRIAPLMWCIQLVLGIGHARRPILPEPPPPA